MLTNTYYEGMLPVKIRSQPDDETCGPTSLHAVYNFFGDKISLEKVIREVPSLDEGGTLAVFLACHALKRGYTAKIYTYNLTMFDPSWFTQMDVDISEKLSEQLKYKKSQKFHRGTEAYIDYLALGGKLLFEDLTPALLLKYFYKNIPILTGLSATYLYKSKREYSARNELTVSDDVRGTPLGHFVVLCGYDGVSNLVTVADPYPNNPVSGENYYSVPVQRFINSVMLGIVTYDANLLIIEPKAT